MEGTQVASNVSLGGQTWQVWQANPGWNFLMFFPTGQRTSASEDLYAIMNWANSHGLLLDPTWTSLQFGVEVTSTNGTQQFTVTHLPANWQ
jgi:hypothetical protein